MEITDILYIVLIVAIIVLTVTVVWLANEAIGLIRSLRKSADDTAVVTREFKEKVLLASEALDRVGTAATTILGMIEDAVSGIKEKRDKLADGIAMVTGLGKYVKGTKKTEDEEESEETDEEDETEPYEQIVVPPKKPAQEKKVEKAKEEKKEVEDKKEKPEEKKPEEKPEKIEEKNKEKDEKSEPKEIKGV